MVVFTCGHCGESVQKPKVEKHYQTKCRNRNPNLSCMDCFKDFLGQAYETHTKCITEEERYSAKGFQAKEKKGEKKQNTWVEMLQAVLDEQANAPKNVLRIIDTVSKHNNTPRKKPKFINFVKNVCGHKTNPKDIDQAWDLISVKLSALSLANTQNQNQNKKNENSEVNKQDKEDDEKDDSGEKRNAEKQNATEKSGNDMEEVDEEDDAAKEECNEEVSNKKLSKKQRKEEKKRKKYEAELQSAETAPTEEEEVPEQVTKKGKKKKTKSECSAGDNEENQQESKNKNKKRKRQDTVNSLPEVPSGTEIEPAAVTKVSKKKVKVNETEELEDSICLHDQNVAKIGELTVSSDQFNWHAVIKSVLQKKDNELPFKRLQKKVLMEYSEATGRDVDDRIADKFIKKLKSAPNVRVDKNRVMLLE